MIISSNFTESTVEQAALAFLESIDWAVRDNVTTGWTLRQNGNGGHPLLLQL